ncbi:S-layer homology domain-containing protein [Candidatus Gracilibacteria bacterium]|nr:S-layer homology domain-containing protein [Candidatus Gracilibacteria bacterium]
MEHRILSCLILILVLTTQSTYALFPDTEYSWYRDSINTLANEDVISGFADGTFGADKTITRAEIVKIFLKAKGDPLLISQKIRCFPDVGITLWYHPYICEAAKLGIVKGFEDGSFGPDRPVTALEALAIGLRLYGISPAVATNPWYLGYREFADKNGIYDTSSYSLITPISRGKASELILAIRSYATQKSPIKSFSRGCTKPGSLGNMPTVEISGKLRSYILTIPPGYSASNPVGIIVAIHGRTNSNTQVQGYMGLEGGRSSGSQSSYIVAYPAGLDAGGGTRSWSAPENVTFFDAIIRDIGDNYCIERSNIFVVAHSLGASFASRLACVRGDVIHAMSIVGGGGWTTPCGQTPTGTLIYQNADDRLSSPATARATERVMRTANTCGAITENIQIGSLTCQKWKDCSTGSPVVWCENYPTYGGDPHSWPTTGGTDILAFFKAL